MHSQIISYILKANFAILKQSNLAIPTVCECKIGWYMWPLEN